MLEKIKQDALDNNVPIMSDETLSIICFSIEAIHAKYVLEFGSAVGYSSLYIAQKCPYTTIDTIEKDEQRYQKALENKALVKDDQVNFIVGDALEYPIDKFYDVIVLDAAKAQNKAFFKRTFPFLKPRGIMFVDNINFHGFVDNIPLGKQKRNLRQMVQKIASFVEYVESLDHVEVTHKNVGDGLLIIKRKKVDFADK
jgi:predicted O-methyltransferase YrrM